MKVSIVVPFYEDRMYIGECISSIKSQLYCDLEAILVDNCSSDGSSSVAMSTIGGDDRFRIIVHEENRGASGARNSGIDEACGDFIFFLDGDDKLPHDEALFELLSAADGAQIVTGNFIRSDGKTASGAGNWTNVTNKLIDLKWLKDNQLYFIEGITYEDVPWAMKAYTVATKVAHVNCPTYYHNLRQGSISRSVFNQFKVESMLRVLRELSKLKQDRFVVSRTVYQTMFLVKNLLLGNFGKHYKRSKYKEIKNLGVLRLRSSSCGLEKFSKVLYLCRKSYFLSSLLCAIYKKWKRC